jgi:hypothetical protein
MGANLCQIIAAHIPMSVNGRQAESEIVARIVAAADRHDERT